MRRLYPNTNCSDWAAAIREMAVHQNHKASGTNSWKEPITGIPSPQRHRFGHWAAISVWRGSTVKAWLRLKQVDTVIEGEFIRQAPLPLPISL